MATTHHVPKQHRTRPLAGHAVPPTAPSTTVANQERPVLAPGVKLAGEMRGSAFQQRQWLVERGGKFAQLTELLYRIAQEADGRRTPEEIALRLGVRTGRSVSPDEVRHLLTKKLVPAGLVVLAPSASAFGAARRRTLRFMPTRLAPIGADGQAAAVPVVPPPTVVGREGARSPLALNVRVALLGPRVIEPVTRVLRYLYLPPVLLALLALVGVAHWWLYTQHGVAGGMRHVLYTPALVLLVYALFVASATVHEFGHATALRYSGGRVRGMGVGMYLAYPAFFTDVTDNYRLGRWARVRTDLGGFYFNLLFTLALFAAYWRTGWEFLLLVVMLIDLEILHQLLPLVRLDGYWLLADLTGVPDFFSLMGPFLRSTLPAAARRGRTLPPLKTWVKAVFGLYVLVALPLLAFLLFAMVRGVPRVMATAWDALGKQSATFVVAHRSGDVLAQVAGGLQLVLLALPVLGVLWMLVSLGRALFGAIWRWSWPTPRRRIAGAFATAAIVAALAFLWVPQAEALFSGFGTPIAGTAGGRYTPIGRDDRGTVRDAIPAATAPPPATVSPPSATAAPPTEPSLPTRTAPPSPVARLVAALQGRSLGTETAAPGKQATGASSGVPSGAPAGTTPAGTTAAAPRVADSGATTSGESVAGVQHVPPAATVGGTATGGREQPSPPAPAGATMGAGTAATPPSAVPHATQTGSSGSGQPQPAASSAATPSTTGVRPAPATSAAASSATAPQATASSSTQTGSPTAAAATSSGTALPAPTSTTATAGTAAPTSAAAAPTAASPPTGTAASPTTVPSSPTTSTSLAPTATAVPATTPSSTTTSATAASSTAAPAPTSTTQTGTTATTAATAATPVTTTTTTSAAGTPSSSAG